MVFLQRVAEPYDTGGGPHEFVYAPIRIGLSTPGDTYVTDEQRLHDVSAKRT